jgi:peptidyl-dipeptidase Dcp
VVTLNRSLIVPFLQFSPRRALRQRAYEAWVARGANGGGPTTGRSRPKSWRCARSGRSCWAMRISRPSSWSPRWRKTPEAVRDLLMRVWAPARARALADAAVLEAMLQGRRHSRPAGALGLALLQREAAQAEHDLDEAALKPYLSLEAMLGAMFDCANRLFGLEFREIDGPFYHPDVRGWEVTRNGGMWRCSWAIISRAARSGRAPGVRRCAPAQAGRRGAADRGQRLQLCQGRALPAVL